MGSWGEGGLTPAGGAVGLVLREQGPGQAGWHLLPWLLPTWAAGSSLEGDVPAPGPPGDTAALSSEPQACLSVPAALSWGQCPDLTATQGQRDGHTTKMDFLQEPRPPGTPGQGVRLLQRLPHCPQSARVFPVEEGCRQEPSVTIPVI